MNFTMCSTQKGAITIRPKVIREVSPSGHPLLAVARAQERTLAHASRTLTASVAISRGSAKDTLRDLSLLLQMPEGVLLSRIIDLAKEKDRAKLRATFL